MYEAASLATLTEYTRLSGSHHGLHTGGCQPRTMDSIHEASILKSIHASWTQYTWLPPHVIDPIHKAASHAFYTQYSRQPVSNHRLNTWGCQPLFMDSNTRLPVSHHGLNSPGCQSQIMDLIHEAISFTSWTQKSRMPVCYHGLNEPGCLPLVTDTTLLKRPIEIFLSVGNFHFLWWRISPMVRQIISKAHNGLFDACSVSPFSHKMAVNKLFNWLQFLRVLKSSNNFHFFFIINNSKKYL